MEITARELRDTEIAEAFRGYNRDVVNDMLERAAAALELAETRMRQAAEQINTVQAEAGRTRETEDILHRTLLLAQRAADEAVAEAQEKARVILQDAETSSRTMVAGAEADAKRRGDAQREKLEAEVMELAERRDALLADVEAMTRFEAEYRDRMVRALEADLAALRTRPAAAPGPRPQTADVEIPTPSATPTPTPVPAEPPRREPTPEATAALDVRAMIEQQVPPTPAAPAPAAPPAPAPVASTPPPPPAPAPAPLSNLEEQIRAATPAATAAPAPPPPVVDTSSRDRHSIDLDDSNVEAEVLDDDAFFATLREAVHDDSPLGPRDEVGRMSFFDEEDADRGSFRDVFRKRR